MKMVRSFSYLCGAAMVLPLFLHATGAQATEADTSDDSGSYIEVLGHADPEGLLPAQTAPKSISAISEDFIAKHAPTMHAYQLVNLLPGANVSSTDPYGLSASSGITVRGMGQDSIGVTMEGAPQNDIGYFVAYPSQFADNENVRQVSLMQGAADIESPSISAIGGLLALTLNDPKSEMGGLINLSAGSYSQRRGFFRFDTGTIGNTNLKAFVSYSNNRADNWRGPGFDKREHIDAKLLNEWGDGNRISLSVSYNNATTTPYASPSLADWKAVGRNYSYSKNYNFGEGSYWRLYRAPFRNVYLTLPVHLKVNDALTFDSSSYLQFGYGNAPYATQLSTTDNFLGTEEITQPLDLPYAQNGVADVVGNWTGKQFRIGNVSKLTVEAGIHTLAAGIWIDHGTDRVHQTYTSIKPDGRPVGSWGYPSEAIRTPDGRLLAYENIRTTTDTRGFFVMDKIAFTPRLGVVLGFKGVNFERNGRNLLPGPQSQVHFERFAALPRASVHYQIDDHQQVFANIATGFRPPNEFALYNSYYGGELVSQGTESTKNERSLSQEIGYRYIGPNLSFSLTGFHYYFRNRHVATIINSGGALVNSTMNGGNQRTYGLDAEVSYRPMEGIGLYLSGEYLNTRLESDLPAQGDYLPTKGNRAIASPKFQFGFGGTYDRGRLFGSAAAKYVGRQYATFMNDESIKGYATLDLTIGVHLAGLIDAQRMDLRLNAINVTNPRVLSGVQAIAQNALDTVGRNGTIISGASPTYYVGSGRAFVVTLSRAF